MTAQRILSSKHDRPADNLVGGRHPDILHGLKDFLKNLVDDHRCGVIVKVKGLIVAGNHPSNYSASAATATVPAVAIVPVAGFPILSSAAGISFAVVTDAGTDASPRTGTLTTCDGEHRSRGIAD